MEGVYETLSARVDELIVARRRPLLSTAGPHAVMKELIARNRGLEQAVREIAREVDELAARPREA